MSVYLRTRIFVFNDYIDEWQGQISELYTTIYY